jgi:PadR family transcriptional regulator
MTRTTVDVLDALVQGFEEDLHGMEICRRTKLQTGTVYPILDRLCRAGWVESQWEDDAEWQETAANKWRPRRRYYRLTALGRPEAARAVGARGSLSQRATVPYPPGVAPGSP